MKVELLFYIIGAFFILGAILYLTYSEIFNLSNLFKSIILLCFTLVFFIAGMYLKECDL